MGYKIVLFHSKWCFSLTLQSVEKHTWCISSPFLSPHKLSTKHHTNTHTHTHMNERKRKKCSLGIEWSIIWGQIRNLHDRKHNVYFFYNFHKIIFCIIFFTHTYEVWEKKRECEREKEIFTRGEVVKNLMSYSKSTWSKPRGEFFS